MPHLSPMMWMYMPLMIWLILIMMSTTAWWISPPSFTPQTSFKINPINFWHWS